MTLDATMKATIRGWAHEAGIPCGAKGILPQRVIDAYWDAHPDQAAAIDAARIDDTPDETEVEGMSVLVTIPDAPDWAETVSQAFADLLGIVFQAGRDAEKSRVLALVRDDAA